MHLRLLKRLSAPVLALVLSGALACAPKVVNYQVKVVTSACVAPSPLQDATHLRFRVTGDGIEEPLIASSAVTAAVQEIPEIPAGSNRVVEVRAYNGDPASGGTVVSMGSSLPFNVPDVVPQDATPVEITIFLRKVGVFTPPSTVVTPTTCSAMLSPRAGHSATILQDGRVFIAGGYLLDSGGNIDATLDLAEIFNPGTGSFETAARMSISSPQQQIPVTKAFHAATLLNNGQVVLYGGMQRSDAALFAAKNVLVYDQTIDRYGAFSPLRARIGAGIALDTGGRVLVVGGTDAAGKPVTNPEWYDPGKASYESRNPSDPTEQERANPKLLPAELPRAGMSVASVQGGKYIAVAGGTDGVKLTDEVTFFNFDGTTFQASASAVRLREVRYAAGVATFQNANNLLLVGGFNSSTDPQTSLSSSEILQTDQFKVSEGQVLSDPRGDVCAASLPDGRVVVFGGRIAGPTGTLSSSSAELISPSEAGGASTLALPLMDTGRYHHSCTTLRDGSVLVLGGREQKASGKPRVLQDAFIYTPPPLD